MKREKMKGLQHNKTIAVDSPTNPIVVCGSTNFSWRGLFVQSNNALILHGKPAVTAFREAFKSYWDHPDGSGFEPAQVWVPLRLPQLAASVTFSPHSADTAVHADVATDIRQAKSSVLYSLAFLWEAGGELRKAITELTEAGEIFVYGVSDNHVDGIDVQRPNANPEPVHPASLNDEDTPPPFRVEPAGGLGPTGAGGVRMHHKFVVIDFDKPDARVYSGSSNFSTAADEKNGENLLLIKDARVAESYAIEALRIFDHYEFRLAQANAATARKQLMLKRPPESADDKPWWDAFYSDPQKARDRTFFA